MQFKTRQGSDLWESKKRGKGAVDIWIDKMPDTGRHELSVSKGLQYPTKTTYATKEQAKKYAAKLRRNL